MEGHTKQLMGNARIIKSNMQVSLPTKTCPGNKKWKQKWMPNIQIESGSLGVLGVSESQTMNCTFAHWRHFREATILKERFKFCKLLLSTMVETTITSNAVFFPQRKKQMGGDVCICWKIGSKVVNFDQLFLPWFSSKICEILHKAVLPPKKYKDYLFRIFK